MVRGLGAGDSQWWLSMSAGNARGYKVRKEEGTPNQR